jgi:hypothetical protein
MQVHFRILVCPHPFILENDTSRSLPPQAKKKKKSNKNHFSYLQKLALVIPRNFTFVFFFLSIYFTQHVVLLFLSSTFGLYVFFFFFFCLREVMSLGLGEDPAGGLAIGLGGWLRRADRPRSRAGDTTGEQISCGLFFWVHKHEENYPF